MYNTVRQQRVQRVERAIEDSVSSARTFQLRRFEGVPSYNGSLIPVSSFSRRDEDDLTVAQRRPPPASSASSCHYAWILILILSVGLLVICMQYTVDMGRVRAVLPDRFARRVLRSENSSRECPVCVCNS